MIWDAEVEIAAAQEYLRSHPGIDGARIGVVGASYSGEEMAEAGRLRGYMRAYAALSPGSFSEESIGGIDASGVRWLFVAARNERHLREITASVQRESRTAEVWIVPGTRHVTRLLRDRPALAERIAGWLARALR
jgi:dipeptidyl aminopeptidase/acylaminoacyl peptidase